MLRTVIICLSVLIFNSISGYDVSPPCYRQLSVNFFREDLVAQGLNIYQVQQSTWSLIYRDLRQASQYVPNIIQNRARAKIPNPLEPPFDPNGAIQVLQDSLYEVFFNVMNKYSTDQYNLINDNTVNGVFRYLWEQQLNRIEQCVYTGR